MLAALAGAPAARADVFGPISLASLGVLEGTGGEGPAQQALYAHDTAVSGNGQYVVFDGYFGGRSGVWRRELTPPYAVAPVAVGAQEPGSERCLGGSACDAELPSISENGQYVSFTTTARLDPEEDTNEAPDVYVRDMDVAESQPCSEEAAPHPAQACPFTLVSAVNGGVDGLSYSGAGAGGYGSVAAGRSAISADGRQVAFVTTAVSNLAGPETPALQVAVRNLTDDETQLVSSEYDARTGQALPGHPVSQTEGGATVGAVFSPGVAPPAFPFENRAYNLPPAVGASISADGSAVTWMGRAIGRQAATLPGEDLAATYAEPLWRSIAGGPLAATRRVTGGSQPESAACAASGETALPGGIAGQSAADPCEGPFAVESRYGVWAGTVGDAIPQLSANGQTVAFLASAQLISLGLDFGRSSEGEADDLYVANMAPGLTRVEALQPLTELASGRESELTADAPIVDFTVSPDGSQVAFSSDRTEFPLGLLSYISPGAAVAGMSELYDADLRDETLTRVTAGYEGGPSERPHTAVTSGERDPYPLRTDGALSPSFSDDGTTLAFSSTASNLVYGDGNTPTVEAGGGSADGSDAFVVTRRSFPPLLTETYVSEAPFSPAVMPEWVLSATARSLPDGQVRLYIDTPGEGQLDASAHSTLPGVSAAAARRRRAERSRATRAQAQPAASSRLVALAATRIDSAEGGLRQLDLTLARPYSGLAATADGLGARVEVVFSEPDKPILRVALAVVFHSRSAPPAHRASRARPSRRHAPETHR